MSKAEEKLAALGLELPEAAAPVANYVGYTVSGKTVYISGQLPYRNGKLAYTGRLGAGVMTEDGHTVPARVLGFVERPIGAIDKIAHGLAGQVVGHTERDGQALADHLSTLAAHAAGRHGGPHTLGHLLGIGQRGCGQEQDELFASHTRSHAGLGHHRFQYLAHRAQYLVAHRVAVAVVE